MKILILANNDTGLYQFRKELISELLCPGSYLEGREAEKAEVYISLPYGEYVPELVKMGCRFIDTPFNRRGMNPLKELKLLKRYRKIIKEVKPNVVLTYTIKPNIYGSFAAKKYKVPHVVNITGLGTALERGGIKQKLLSIMYKTALTKANCVFFQNQANKEFFENKKIALSKHKMLPGSGVNLDKYSLTEYPSGENIEFAFIGRVMKEKGIDNYLETAKEIKSVYPNTVFHVCGFCEDEYNGKLSAYAEDGMVIYHGMVKDVKPIIEKASAVILPSYHEGLANVLLEASAMGRPVIASNINGCKETFDEGVTGFGVKVNDSEDLINTVKKFINLPIEIKEAMGKRAREKVQNEFDRRIVVKKYVEVIESIKG